MALSNINKGIAPETRRALAKLDLDDAISIQERLIKNAPMGEPHSDQIGNEHFVLAQLYLLKGSNREAELHLYKAYKAAPKDPDIGLSLAEQYQENDEITKAVDLYEKDLIPNYTQLANQTTSTNHLYKLALSSAHNDLGELYRDKKQFDKAESHLATALSIRLKADTLSEGDSYIYNNKSIESLRAETLSNLGSLAADTKNIDGAVFFYERAIQIKRSELSERNTIANRSSLARTAHNYGTVLLSYGMYSQAENSLNEAITHRNHLVNVDPKNLSTQEGLANSLFALGAVYEKERNITKAVAMLDESAEHFKTLAAFSKNSYGLDLTRALNLKAHILYNARQFEAALAAARVVASSLNETDTEQSSPPYILEYLSCHTLLGTLYKSLGKDNNATEHFAKVTTKLNGLDRNFIDTLDDESNIKFSQLCSTIINNPIHLQTSKEITPCGNSSARANGLRSSSSGATGTTRL